eukprot:2167211-Prymnesium_polylepis.1
MPARRPSRPGMALARKGAASHHCGTMSRRPSWLERKPVPDGARRALSPVPYALPLRAHAEPARSLHDARAEPARSFHGARAPLALGAPWRHLTCVLARTAHGGAPLARARLEHVDVGGVDAKRLLQHRQQQAGAVRRARPVRDDRFARVRMLVVDAENERHRILGRARDKHLFDGAAQVAVGGGARGEEAGALDHK